MSCATTGAKKNGKEARREDFDEYGDVKNTSEVVNCSGHLFLRIIISRREYVKKSQTWTWVPPKSNYNVDKHHRRDDVAGIVRKHFEYV